MLTGGRPTSEAVDALTASCTAAMLDLLRDQPEMPVPGPVGRWLTELFNEWPEGSRPTIEPAVESASPSAS
jgi:hypothetical protein